jgi:hypothetical protein
MYVNLLERGEFGGFEDAILILNDIGGIPLDLNVGQFQVSDPLFKREVRLMFEDYIVYRANIGANSNLTYDRDLSPRWTSSDYSHRAAARQQRHRPGRRPTVR